MRCCTCSSLNHLFMCMLFVCTFHVCSRLTQKCTVRHKSAALAWRMWCVRARLCARATPNTLNWSQSWILWLHTYIHTPLRPDAQASNIWGCEGRLVKGCGCVCVYLGVRRAQSPLSAREKQRGHGTETLAVRPRGCLLLIPSWAPTGGCQCDGCWRKSTTEKGRRCSIQPYAAVRHNAVTNTYIHTHTLINRDLSTVFTRIVFVSFHGVRLKWW